MSLGDDPRAPAEPPPASRTSLSGAGRVRVAPHVTRRTAALAQLEEDGPTRVVQVGKDLRLEGRVRALDAACEFAYGGEHPRAKMLLEHRGSTVVAAVEKLDDAAIAFVERISHLCPSMIVVAGGEADRRAALSEVARRAGARAFVLRDELGPSTLAAALAHAKDVGRLRAEVAVLAERFDLAVRGANDGLWEWDLERDRAFFSQRWCELLGLEAVEVSKQLEAWFERVHPRDLKGLQAQIQLHLEGSTANLQYEHRVRHADGDYRWMLVRGATARSSKGEARRLAGSFTDVTRYREHASSLRAFARQDAVTELPGRAVLVERLARSIELDRQYSDYSYTVLLVDITRLETIAQGLGGRGADLLLGQAARRLAPLCRGEDLVAHIERGQFAVLLENLEDSGDGPSLAGRIHEAFRQPFEILGESLFAAVSIGMTSNAHAYENVDDVLADLRLAARRSSGAGAGEGRDTQLRIEALTLLRLEMALHDAIAAEQFELFYQPIVDFERWSLFGFEALLRWSHPTRGMVSPGEFIPVAEDTGLIVPIGRWALREACRQIRSWIDAHGLPDNFALSVNMSARQTSDPMLLPTLREAMAEFEVPAGRLKLELTESAVMGDPAEGAKLLAQLRELGCALYIDDFGTGYSSLSYLHQLPIDGLKVDRSFVEELDGSSDSAKMVRVILDLARNLEVDVVAEGVETDIQAEQLLDMGCKKLQGYRFARPMRAAAATDLVAEGPGAFRKLGAG